MQKSIIRKEFFGAIVWDPSAKDYFMIAGADFNELNQNLTFNYRIVNTEIECDGFLTYPLRVHLALTDQCNTICKHCFFSDIPTQNIIQRLLNLQEIKSLLDEMSYYGCMELFIGGGEPFLRNDWHDIFKYAENKHIQLFIFTNGTLLSKDLINKLNMLDNIGYLSVSTEGCNSESYSITRQKEMWKPLVDGLKLLSELANFPVFIRYTATSSNISHFSKLVEFVDKVGNGKIGIKVRPLLPCGNTKINDYLLLEYKEYLDFLLKIKQEIKTKLNIDLSVSKDTDPRKGFYRFSRKTIGFSRFVPPYTGFGGSGAYTSVYIDPYGGVQDCVMTYDYNNATPDNNIRNGGLLFQWHTAKSILKRRNLVGNEECYDCEYYIWCRGGCRARAIYYYHDENAKDPWCFKDLINIYGTDEVEILFENLNEG